MHLALSGPILFSQQGRINCQKTAKLSFYPKLRILANVVFLNHADGYANTERARNVYQPLRRLVLWEGMGCSQQEA
jgi:hypothetical protein